MQISTWSFMNVIMHKLFITAYDMISTFHSFLQLVSHKKTHIHSYYCNNFFAREMTNLTILYELPQPRNPSSGIPLEQLTQKTF